MPAKPKNNSKITFNFTAEMLIRMRLNSESPLYHLYEDINSSANAVDQIRLLKSIQDIISGSKTKSVNILTPIDYEFLCFMFYQSPLKSYHKKTLRTILKDLALMQEEIIKNSLQISLKSIISASFETLIIENIENYVIALLSLLDYFPPGPSVIEEEFTLVWKHLARSLEYINQELKKPNCADLFGICQSVLNVCILIFQNCEQIRTHLVNSQNDIFQYSQVITKTQEILLLNSDTSLNCCLNAGIAFCHYHFITDPVTFKANIFNQDENASFIIKKFPPTSQLCILSGVMAVFHTEDFVSTLNNNLVAEIIIHKILQISKNVDDSDLLLLSTRDLIQWTNAMSKILSSEDVKSLNSVKKLFQANGEIIDKLFKFVFCYREHYVDTLRHLTKELFKNILNLHVLSISTDVFESPLLRETTAFLLNKLPQHSQGKYGLLSCLAEIVGNNGFLQWYPGLPGILYEALKDINLYSHISELLETLFKKSLDDMCDSEFITVWLRPLLMSLNSESKELLTALNEHLLPKLFIIRPHSINFLLSEFNSLWKNNQRNCFSALITCVKFQQRQKREESVFAFISRESLTKALCHAEDSVRLSAFSLICESPKTTEIISQNIFQLIQDILPYNINCQAPAFRQQLVSYIKKLLNRMVESKYSLEKKKQNKGDSHNCHSSVERYYQDFLFWLKKYLYSCLYPGANFPRRVTALNLLYLLQTTVAEMLPIVENFSDVQSLLCVLQDTYENNKIIALKILQSTDIEIFETGDEQFLEHLLKTALILACSTKPPDTVTASYLFAFMVRCKTFKPLLLELLSKQRVEGLNLLPCCTEEVFSKLFDSSSFIALLFLAGELEKQLEVAQKSLLNAAASAPLYGVLACIRSILSQSNFKHLEDKFSLDQWAVLMKLIISLTIKVANVVEPVVCNSSPEGYLPKDTDSKSVMQLQATVRRAIGKRFQSAVVKTDNILPESDKIVLDMVKTHAVTSQILLLCCWRAHKEVSLLFGEISERIPIKNIANQVESGIIDVNLVLDIGGYFMFQMTSVIHKGAFEQAYIGFSKFCHMLWRSSMSELRKLPKIWLNDVFLSIKGLNGTIPLCSTRRSAGLPFVVQAILTSEPFASSSLYKDTISKLLSMASIEEDTENFNEKVHALNILRALFRDATLSDELIHFVSKALKVSIIGFNSKIWAVRNSCTLLFTALMARIFGTKASQDEAGKKNRLSGRTFFSYYKDLYNFLYCELKHCSAVLHQDQATCSISLLPTLYPILLILGRLYPAPGEQDPYLSSFIPFINACARSPIWKVRVASAKAFIPLIPAERFSRTFKFLLDSLPFDDNFLIHHHNKFHGKCLQILHLLKECQHLSDFHKKQVEKHLAPRIQSILELVLKLDKCFTVKSTLLNIVLTAFEIPMNITIDSAVLVKLIIEITSKEGLNCIDPGKELYLCLAHSIVFLSLPLMDENTVFELWQKLNFHCVNSLSTLMRTFLQSPHESVRGLILQALICFFKVSIESTLQPILFPKSLGIAVNHLKEKQLSAFDDLCQESFSVFILNMTRSENSNSSCLGLVYELLCLMPPAVKVYWPPCFCCKLEYILSQIRSCKSDDTSAPMLLFSTHVAVHTYNSFAERKIEPGTDSSNCVNCLKNLEGWSKIMEESAEPENCVSKRMAIIQSLQIIPHEMLLDSFRISNGLAVHLWEAILSLLTDDEPEIKQLCSELIISMKYPDVLDPLPVVPSLALDHMIGMFIEKEICPPPQCVGILLNWMVSCKIKDMDYTGDEQPFDRGELNVFSEDLLLTSFVYRHLSLFLKDKCTHPDSSLALEEVSGFQPTSHFKDRTGISVESIVKKFLFNCEEILDSLITCDAASSMLDTQFDVDVLQMSQQLLVVLCFLPWISEALQSQVKEVMRKVKTIKYRTFFLENLLTES